MSDTLEPLIVDLLQSLVDGERLYDELMDAWRTSCPKLPVWEEANRRDLVTRFVKDGVPVVAITPAGRAVLQRR